MATWHELVCWIRVDDSLRIQREIELQPDLIFSSDEQGWTLLMASAANKAYRCIQFLVSAGADINKKSKSGRTALILAVCCKSFDIACFLLAQGGTVSSRTKEKMSAFDIAMFLYNQKDMTAWFELFALYKEKFDAKDLAHYHQLRLCTLFVRGVL